MRTTYRRPPSSRPKLTMSLLMALACMLIPLQGVAQGQSRTITGDLDLLIADDFENNRAHRRYHVKDDSTGEHYSLEFRGKPPKGLKNGQKVKIRGKALGKKLTVDELSQSPSADADDGTQQDTDAAASTARKAVLILVDFRDAQHAAGRFADPVALTKQQMYSADQSVNKMYQTASQGQMSFDPDVDGDGAPDVFGPYQIDHNYGDSSCSYYDWSSAAEAAAQADGVDLSLYQHKVFVLPFYRDFSFGCGWSGIANTSCATSCRAWTAEPQSGMVLAHELGHNLNLAHASTDPENDGIVNSEYGDGSDPMGSSRNWTVFNAAHTQEMAWFDDTQNQILDVTGSGTYYLHPLDDAANGMPGLRALRLNRSDHSDYYISYRKQVGTFSGVGTGYANKINLHSHSTADGYERTLFIKTLSVGATFEDPETGLSLTVLGDPGDGTAAMQVSYGCAATAPSMSLTPTNAAGRDGGESVNYMVTINNNDSSGCPASAYVLTTTPNSSLNDAVSASLLPGQTWTGRFELACSSDGCANLGFSAGPNTVRVTASDSDSRNMDNNALFVRDNTPPSAPGALEVSINKKGRGTISWTGSSDKESSVDHYLLSLNGGSEVIVKGTTFSYNNAKAGDTVSVAAVDLAGNMSTRSSSLATTSSKGGKPTGGSTKPSDGGTKPCRGKKCSG